MVHLYNWNVTEYGNAYTESGADEFVQILSEDEFNELKGDEENLLQKFEEILTQKLIEKVNEGDIVVHQRSLHIEIKNSLEKAHHLEMGGSESEFTLKTFESQADMHFYYGYGVKHGSNHNWVVRRYFDAAQYSLTKVKPNKPIVFFGNLDHKYDFELLAEVIKLLPHRNFVIIGKGDYETHFGNLENVRHIESFGGKTKRELLAGAAAVVCPIVSVTYYPTFLYEAQLLGIPAIISNFGPGTDLIEQGENGFLCNTIGDWVAAIIQSENLDRRKIRRRAVKNFSLGSVGEKLDAIFSLIKDLSDDGYFRGIRYTVDFQPIDTNASI